MIGLGAALGAVLVLGATVQPWYLLWAAIPLASAAGNTRFRTGGDVHQRGVRGGPAADRQHVRRPHLPAAVRLHRARRSWWRSLASAVARCASDIPPVRPPRRSTRHRAPERPRARPSEGPRNSLAAVSAACGRAVGAGQALRRDDRRRRAEPAAGPWAGARPAGPERRGQDHHRRDLRGLPAPRRAATSGCSASTRRRDHERLRPAHRRDAAGRRRLPGCAGGGDARAGRGVRGRTRSTRRG